jgi:glycerol uptake facilitator-like aquaporin
VFPGLVDQIVGTALLVAVISPSPTHATRPPAPAPVVVGLLVVLIGATFDSIPDRSNPARDFGPRLFTAVAGWGMEVFRAGNGGGGADRRSTIGRRGWL